MSHEINVEQKVNHVGMKLVLILPFRNSYRQRNVFFYPPQLQSICDTTNNAVTGDGECGLNGNTKVFQADQTATTCSSGDIEGIFKQGPFSLPTKTELIGKDNALLYQVFVPGEMIGQEEDQLMQSQRTTITKSPTGQVYRTRTAQGFDTFVNFGQSTYASYYRERKVDKDEFYEELQNSIEVYNIIEEDLCSWDGQGQAVPNVVGSFQTCEDHLESSFDLSPPVFRSAFS